MNYATKFGLHNKEERNLPKITPLCTIIKDLHPLDLDSRENELFLFARFLKTSSISALPILSILLLNPYLIYPLLPQVMEGRR